jgi:ATP-dependent Clp protease ATP-binding subunit ClpC
MDTGRASRPTPRYRRVVETAAQVARDLGHEYIGTEHLFLAILADPDAVPTQVMAELIEPAVVAARVRDVMERY